MNKSDKNTGDSNSSNNNIMVEQKQYQLQDATILQQKDDEQHFLENPALQKIRKCLFTANPLQTKFNVSATPFISSTSISTTTNAINKSSGDILNSIRICAGGGGQQNAVTAGGGGGGGISTPPSITISNNCDARIWRSISARPATAASAAALAPGGTTGGLSLGFSNSNEFLPSQINLHNTYSARNLNYNNPRLHNSYADTTSRSAFGGANGGQTIGGGPSVSMGPIALQNGIILIFLRENIRIEMTIDKAVRVVNQRTKIYTAFSSSANSAALIHPNGRVYQYTSRVELVAYDGMRNNNYKRYAKMWYKGISFTSENCALVYLVDSAGTRTTTDTFTDLSEDYTLGVLFSDSCHGPAYSKEALEVIQNCNYWRTEDGTDIFEINNFRISQAADGLVKVLRLNNKSLIRTSPLNGSVTLTTPFMHCTASLGQTSHMFVRRGERRMHFDGVSFVVRNAGHSAGFDENNLLKVY